jgi:hypothetical protein
MRLGLVTDIHNDAVNLARALALFRTSAVDQVVTIGDTCDAFSKGDGADEVAALLDAVGAVGVWGNHDFSLCRDVPERIRARSSAFVLKMMARMEPRLIIGDCHFSHKESTVDPFDVLQLWNVSEHRLDLAEKAQQAFATVTSAWQFVGHYHRWWAATPTGPLDWTGTEPLHLETGERYFIVVAAVMNGWCGILDTEEGVLTPLRCDE